MATTIPHVGTIRDSQIVRRTQPQHDRPDDVLQHLAGLSRASPKDLFPFVDALFEGCTQQTTILRFAGIEQGSHITQAEVRVLQFVHQHRDVAAGFDGLGEIDDLGFEFLLFGLQRKTVDAIGHEDGVEHAVNERRLQHFALNDPEDPILGLLDG